MEGDLSAAVGADDGNVTGQQHMLVAPGNALGKNAIVFNQPQLVGRVGSARSREGAHGGFDLDIGAPPQHLQLHAGVTAHLE